MMQSIWGSAAHRDRIHRHAADAIGDEGRQHYDMTTWAYRLGSGTLGAACLILAPRSWLRAYHGLVTSYKAFEIVVGCPEAMRLMFQRQPRKRNQQVALCVALLVGVISAPLPTWAQAASAGGEWREFQGTWTAVGKRHVIPLGGDRRASIADFNGSLMLSGPSRPTVGFLAEAIVLNDSVTGMLGRAVWTDERGDQVFSEIRGETTATGNRLFGTFLGGSGRYAGAIGSYEFSWRFLLEAEDGTIQGQSTGLKGQVRAAAPQGAPNAGSSQ